MGYLINPFGRMVAIDNPDEYQKFLTTSGFRKPTSEEEQKFIQSRVAMVEEMKNATEPDNNEVYMATVSQSGNDGYAISGARILEELRTMGTKISTSYKKQKVALLYHNPYSVLRLESPIRIIFTMFESTKIPDDWIPYLEAADMVIVPSKWCQEVFKKSGIETKVVPLGYDDKMYQYVERPIKRDNRQDFKFLHYNAFNLRKGFPEVFKAFTKEFKKDEPVKLVLKTTLDEIPLPISPTEYPNIEIIRGKKPIKDLVELCNKCDCFVFPSRGEGFGMTPLEAMATGIPAIVPNAHGISEYFDDKYMYEVKVKEECPAIYSRYKGVDVGKMVICDEDDLRKKMRWVYEHQEEAREMGKKAAEYAKQWTYTNSAKKLKVLLDEALAMNPKNRPLKNALTLEMVQ